MRNEFLAALFVKFFFYLRNISRYKIPSLFVPLSLKNRVIYVVFLQDLYFMFAKQPAHNKTFSYEEKVHKLVSAMPAAAAYAGAGRFLYRV